MKETFSLSVAAKKLSPFSDAKDQGAGAVGSDFATLHGGTESGVTVFPLLSFSQSLFISD